MTEEEFNDWCGDDHSIFHAILGVVVVIVTLFLAGFAFSATPEFVVENKVTATPIFTVTNKVSSPTLTERFTTTDGVTYEKHPDGVYRAVPGGAVVTRPFSTSLITVQPAGGRNTLWIRSTETGRIPIGVPMTGQFGPIENCSPFG